MTKSHQVIFDQAQNILDDKINIITAVINSKIYYLMTLDDHPIKSSIFFINYTYTTRSVLVP